VDVFRRKISKKDLSCVFPDYKGGNDFQIGIEFIKNKYQSCVKNSERMKIFVIMQWMKIL
jgi:hypothetical protein